MEVIFSQSLSKSVKFAISTDFSATHVWCSGTTMPKDFTPPARQVKQVQEETALESGGYLVTSRLSLELGREHNKDIVVCRAEHEALKEPMARNVTLNVLCKLAAPSLQAWSKNKLFTHN